MVRSPHTAIGPRRVLQDEDMVDVVPETMSATSSTGGSARSGVPSHASRSNVTRTPSQPASLSNATQTTLQQDTRTKIQLTNKLMEPSGRISRRITKILFLDIDEEGYQWRKIPRPKKEFYWQEFKKLFSWPTNMETAIKTSWTSRVRR